MEKIIFLTLISLNYISINYKLYILFLFILIILIILNFNNIKLYLINILENKFFKIQTYYIILHMISNENFDFKMGPNI